MRKTDPWSLQPFDVESNLFLQDFCFDGDDVLKSPEFFDCLQREQERSILFSFRFADDELIFGLRTLVLLSHERLRSFDTFENSIELDGFLCSGFHVSERCPSFVQLFLADDYYILRLLTVRLFHLGLQASSE